MKKLILFIIGLVFTTTLFAQSEYLKAYEFSYKLLLTDGWTDWSSWKEVNIDVKIDIDNDKVIIYSEEPQIYRVIKQEEDPYDDRGTQIKFQIIDQDGDYGHLRFRKQYNGALQIYIDFADIKWVYNLK